MVMYRIDRQIPSFSKLPWLTPRYANISTKSLVSFSTASFMLCCDPFPKSTPSKSINRNQLGSLLMSRYALESLDAAAPLEGREPVRSRRTCRAAMSLLMIPARSGIELDVGSSVTEESFVVVHRVVGGY